MLNREWLTNLHLTTSEIIETLKAYYYDMTPFEQMLYNALAEHADVIDVIEQGDMDDVDLSLNAFKLGSFCMENDLMDKQDVAKASRCKEALEEEPLASLAEQIESVIMPELENAQYEYEKVMRANENPGLDDLSWTRESEDAYYEAEEKRDALEEASKSLLRACKELDRLSDYHYNGLN